MRFDHRFRLSIACLLFAFAMACSAGCGDESNKVIQPAGGEPTPEEAAAYEKEVEEMINERG